MIGITGSSSPIGRLLLAECDTAGLSVVGLARHPLPTERLWDLEDPDTDSAFEGLSSVIHLAWSWAGPNQENYAKNVTGGIRVLEAIRARGGGAVLLSTMSAESESTYGRAKRTLESAFVAEGGTALRAGVIWMQGGILTTIDRISNLPGLCVHIRPDPELLISPPDELVKALIRGAQGHFPGLYIAAGEQPETLSQISHGLRQRRAILHPAVSSHLLRGAANAAEYFRVPIPLRADSLESLTRPSSPHSRPPFLAGFAPAPTVKDLVTAGLRQGSGEAES